MAHREVHYWTRRKRRWKQGTEDLYRRDKRMTESDDEQSSEEEPAVLEREVKAALNALGGAKTPAVDGIAIELLYVTETITILTRICQQVRNINNLR